MLLMLLAGIWALIGVVGPAEAMAPVSITSQSIPRTDTGSVQILDAGNGRTTTKINGQLIPASTNKAAASFPFNGFRFEAPFVCQDDNIGGGYYYPTIGAGNYLEYNASPVTLANDQGETYPNCSVYPQNRTLHYYLYNDPNFAGCWKLDGAWDTDGPWSYWVVVSLSINVYPSYCSVGAQSRANAVSTGTAAALGLLVYGPTNNGDNCIQNKWYQDVYSMAGDCETNRLDWMY